MQSDYIPEGFLPIDDMPHERPSDAPEGWSESYAVWAYMEDSYLYMHFQRHADDSGLWRAYAVVLGEDGSVLSTHNFGRQYTDFGPGYQQVHCVVEKPFEVFHVKIDAVAQISDRDTLRKQTIQSLDDRITPLKVDFRFNSIAPTFQPMPQSDSAAHSNSKWTHYTPCKIDGYITIGSERKYVECLGWRDHSAGARSFSSMVDGYMFTGIFPSGKTYMAIGVGTEMPDGEIMRRSFGGVTIDGKTSYATKITTTKKAASLPEPNADWGSLIFETDHGTTEIKQRTLGQGIPLGLYPPNLESIGLRDGVDSPLFYHEWRMEIECDGEIGIGGWEPCICNR